MDHYEFLLKSQQLEFDKQRHQDLLELEWARLNQSTPVSEEEIQGILNEIAEEDDEEECDCPFCRIERALADLREELCG